MRFTAILAIAATFVGFAMAGVWVLLLTCQDLRLTRLSTDGPRCALSARWIRGRVHIQSLLRMFLPWVDFSTIIRVKDGANYFNRNRRVGKRDIANRMISPIKRGISRTEHTSFGTNILRSHFLWYQTDRLPELIIYLTSTKITKIYSVESTLTSASIL